jgi:hypothetical protein
MSQVTDLGDLATRTYNSWSQWHGWLLVCMCMILVYLVAFFDVVRRSNKREWTMSSRKFSKHQGPKVEMLIFNALSEARIKDEISEATFNFWARFFSWYGFRRFKNIEKIKKDSPKANWLKQRVLDSLDLMEKEKPAKLPG